ncbi:hypothetical protein FRC11_002840, partial [Ceratobasidium sp. 423]
MSCSHRFRPYGRSAICSCLWVFSTGPDPQAGKAAAASFGNIILPLFSSFLARKYGKGGS